MLSLSVIDPFLLCARLSFCKTGSQWERCRGTLRKGITPHRNPLQLNMVFLELKGCLLSEQVFCSGTASLLAPCPPTRDGSCGEMREAMRSLRSLSHHPNAWLFRGAGLVPGLRCSQPGPPLELSPKAVSAVVGKRGFGLGAISK